MSLLKVPGKTDVVMPHLHQVQDVVFSSGTFDWNISALLPFLMANADEILPKQFHYKATLWIPDLDAAVGNPGVDFQYLNTATVTILFCFDCIFHYLTKKMENML